MHPYQIPQRILDIATAGPEVHVATAAAQLALTDLCVRAMLNGALELAMRDMQKRRPPKVGDRRSWRSGASGTAHTVPVGTMLGAK